MGPHRMFVHAARRWADRGHPVLRFDFRGRGESEGSTLQTTIPGMIADTLAALDFLHDREDLCRVVLVGLCSGSKVALGAAVQHSAVAGLALWSPELPAPLRHGVARGRRILARLRHYALQLLRPGTWRRLLTGRVNFRLARKAMFCGQSIPRDEARAERELVNAFSQYRGPVLCVFGGGDPDTPQALAGYQELLARPAIRASFHTIPRADHNFTSLPWEEELLNVTERWLETEF